jgi:hypothetical protein
MDSSKARFQKLDGKHERGAFEWDGRPLSRASTMTGVRLSSNTEMARELHIYILTKVPFSGVGWFRRVCA